ncbi:MAG: hypothetical protein QUS14_17160 [Pyrinomonadaceae bacterium]|nr:hypothetical protein [Pyrinomonadaceae bacterium]
MPISSALPQSSNDLSRRAAELIHYGDLIDIDVVGSFEYDWRGTLTQEGFIDGNERLQ